MSRMRNSSRTFLVIVFTFVCLHGKTQGQGDMEDDVRVLTSVTVDAPPFSWYGGRAELACSIQPAGLFFDTVYWWRRADDDGEGVFIFSYVGGRADRTAPKADLVGRATSRVDANVHRLTIDNVTAAADEASYRCDVIAGADGHTQRYSDWTDKMIVVRPPFNLTMTVNGTAVQNYSSVSVDGASRVAVVCTASSWPDVELTWSLQPAGGAPVDDGGTTCERAAGDAAVVECRSEADVSVELLASNTTTLTCTARFTDPRFNAKGRLSAVLFYGAFVPQAVSSAYVAMGITLAVVFIVVITLLIVFLVWKKTKRGRVPLHPGTEIFLDNSCKRNAEPGKATAA